MDYFVKKDYYKILGVASNASNDDIKAAFRKLAKEYHPDLHSNNPLIKLADEKFKEINEAYEILNDEKKRKEYDAQREPIFEKNNQSRGNSTSESSQNNDNLYNERSKYSETPPKTQKRKSAGTDKAEFCYKHAGRIRVANCETCGIPLCEECATKFNYIFCPKCLIKNNDKYMRNLVSPLYIAVLALIMGFVAGIFLGMRFGILSNNGIIEGIILGTYLMGLALYFCYFSGRVETGIIRILKIINYLLDMSQEVFLTILYVLNTIVGLVLGWILGIFFGIFRLIKDYIKYLEFKPEYSRMKKLIKNNY